MSFSLCPVLFSPPILYTYSFILNSLKYSPLPLNSHSPHVIACFRKLVLTIYVVLSFAIYS